MAVPSPSFLATQALTEAGTPAPGLMSQTSIRALGGVPSGGFMLSVLAGKSSQIILSTPMTPDGTYNHLGFTGGSAGVHSFQLDVQVVAGGTAPFTYSWTRSPTANLAPVGSTTTVLSNWNYSYNAGGGMYQGVVTCVVTDSLGKTATATIAIDIEMSN